MTWNFPSFFQILDLDSVLKVHTHSVGWVPLNVWIKAWGELTMHTKSYKFHLKKTPILEKGPKKVNIDIDTAYEIKFNALCPLDLQNW